MLLISDSFEIMLKSDNLYLGLSVLLLLCTCCHVSYGQQTYAVMAPKSVRPNIDYLAAVTVQNIGGELQVSRQSYSTFSCLKVGNRRLKIMQTIIERNYDIYLV